MKPVTFQALLDTQDYYRKDSWIKRYYKSKGKLPRYRARERWLLKTLPSPGHISKRWEEVGEDAHFLWGVIAALGGCATRRRIENFLRGSRVSVVRKDGTAVLGDRSVDSLLESLYDAALVLKYRGGAYYSDLYEEGGLWVIPESVSEMFRKSQIPKVISRLKEPDESASLLPTDVRMFQRDALFLWGNMWREPMKLLVSGHIGKRIFQTIRPFLHGVEPEATSEKESFYVRFLHSLLLSAGLSQRADGYLYASSTAGKPHRFWSLPLLKRFNTVWKALWDVNWNFVSSVFLEGLIDVLKTPKESKRKWLKRFLELVKDNLESMSPGDKVSLQMLWIWMIESSSIQGCVKTGYSLEEMSEELRSGWEERALAESIARSLYWIGVADLLLKDGQPVGISLSPLGQALLKGSPPAEEPIAKPVVQPNFQILAIGPVPLGDLAFLEAIGKRVKAEKGVVEYKLDRMTFLNSLAAGMDGEYALKRLEEIAGAGVPQNVRRSLSEWINEFERVTIYEGGILVEAKTPALLNRVLATISKKRVVRLGETRALVSSALKDQLDASLLRYGILPDVIDRPDAVDGSIEISPDGRIRSRLPFPSLYVTGRLNKLAEPQPDGTWLLTKESLHRASRHMEAEEILDTLRKMSGSPLPKEVETRVLTWSGFFGNVRVMRVTLLQFRDDSALKAARKLPGLSRMLKDFPYAPGKGLAVVRDSKLQEIISRLEGHDIHVEVVSNI